MREAENDAQRTMIGKAYGNLHAARTNKFWQDFGGLVRGKVGDFVGGIPTGKDYFGQRHLDIGSPVDLVNGILGRIGFRFGKAWDELIPNSGSPSPPPNRGGSTPASRRRRVRRPRSCRSC